MIIDKLENAHLYYAVSPNLEFALRYLEEHRDELEKQPDGPVKLNDNVQIKYIRFESVEGDRRWESHLEFTDLQYVIRGRERIGFANAELMHDPEKQEGKDQILHKGNGDRILVPEGYFMVLFPGEAHMSKLADGKSAPAMKAAFKIRL